MAATPAANTSTRRMRQLRNLHRTRQHVRRRRGGAGAAPGMEPYEASSGRGAIADVGEGAAGGGEGGGDGETDGARKVAEGNEQGGGIGKRLRRYKEGEGPVASRVFTRAATIFLCAPSTGALTGAFWGGYVIQNGGGDCKPCTVS